MPNFPIQFTHPWLLFLIVPLLGVAFFLFFRVKKKYRRTRNRVISLVLHCIASVLCVCVLSGIYIQYSIPNESNEIIFVVDVSDSEERADAEQDSARVRDDFLQTALTAGMYDGFKMGVVTFAFDQVYAVPLTTDIGGIFAAYSEAELPSEMGGTDIAAALTYANGLFSESASSKIVLVTDGKETDEDASLIISSIANTGTSVDTVHIPSDYAADDVQFIGVEYPDYHIEKDIEFTLNYTLFSKSAQTVTVKIFDNGEELPSQEIELQAGSQTFAFPHTFQEEGLHELRFEVVSSDRIQENNTYYSYYNLEMFNDILIVERAEGESDKLVEILEEGEYNATVLNVNDPEADFPESALELCIYDQVILNNIANKDMPEGFVDVLYSYVNDYGGGMLTVGGKDEEGKDANAYDRADMYGTTYQSMLPVEAINYTPPIAVMIVIDTSGSMGGSMDDGESMLSWARAGASACLDALTERDYIGLMTLDENYNTVLPLTSRTQEDRIRSAIASLTEANGGTSFVSAIEYAGIALRSQNNVAKRHIIIVSDGMVPQTEEERYLEYIDNFYKTDGITLSVVGVGVSPGSTVANQMQKACDAGHGRLHAVDNTNDLIREMREELNVEEIKGVNEYEDGFYPVAYNEAANIFNGVALEDGEMTVTLGGFFGTKVRDNDYLLLAGDYNVPLYAQWKFGAGSVGSFMCDLTGSGWSEQFMSDENGKQFIWNMVSGLIPVSDITPPPFQVSLERGNLINRLSVTAELEEGQTVRGKIVSTDGEMSLSLNTGEGGTNDCYVQQLLDASTHYSRCVFVLKQEGIYEIILDICDAEGNAVLTYREYLNFSYSSEYGQSEEDGEALLSSLAQRGGGEVVADLMNPVSIFDNFETSFEMTYDPAIILLISAIVLFLLDVAVRKFKFKWIHEIIREKKNKHSE